MQDAQDGLSHDLTTRLDRTPLRSIAVEPLVSAFQSLQAAGWGTQGARTESRGRRTYQLRSS